MEEIKLETKAGNQIKTEAKAAASRANVQGRTAAKPAKVKSAQKQPVVMPEVKLFNKWGTKGIEVKDLGLQRYISLRAVLVPKSHGRMRSQFHK
ncbi:MAG: hypothetical protein WA139_06050, partial [Candidatus Aenigmatarchaeota archaeon]